MAISYWSTSRIPIYTRSNELTQLRTKIGAFSAMRLVDNALQHTLGLQPQSDTGANAAPERSGAAAHPSLAQYYRQVGAVGEVQPEFAAVGVVPRTDVEGIVEHSIAVRPQGIIVAVAKTALAEPNPVCAI